MNSGVGAKVLKLWAWLSISQSLSWMSPVLSELECPPLATVGGCLEEEQSSKSYDTESFQGSYFTDLQLNQWCLVQMSECGLKKKTWFKMLSAII